MLSTQHSMRLRVSCSIHNSTPHYATITSPPYGKSTIMHPSHTTFRPSFVEKPMVVKVEYSRPRFTSTTSMTTGFRPQYERLKGRLDAELGSGVQIVGGPGRNSAFEVYADGKLLHSKLGGSGGKLNAEGVPVWTTAECKALAAKLKPLMR
jgi:hypothetical protein